MHKYILFAIFLLSFNSGVCFASDKFIEAVKSGDINAVEKLISEGEDVNQTYGSFKSPAVFATQGFNENIKMMKFLVSNGADINATDRDDSSLLMNSVTFGSHDYIEYLLKNGADPNHTDKDQSYPLSLACTKGKLDVVKLLVDYGADVNKVTGGITFGYSPLISAVMNGNPEVVSFLLRNGADVSYHSSDGTALEIAVALQKDDIVTLLHKR